MNTVQSLVCMIACVVLLQQNQLDSVPQPQCTDAASIPEIAATTQPINEAAATTQPINEAAATTQPFSEAAATTQPISEAAAIIQPISEAAATALHTAGVKPVHSDYALPVSATEEQNSSADKTADQPKKATRKQRYNKSKLQ